MVLNGYENAFVPNEFFPFEFTAKNVYNNYSNGANVDIFRYRETGYKKFLLVKKTSVYLLRIRRI